VRGDVRSTVAAVFIRLCSFSKDVQSNIPPDLSVEKGEVNESPWSSCLSLWIATRRSLDPLFSFGLSSCSRRNSPSGFKKCAPHGWGSPALQHFNSNTNFCFVGLPTTRRNFSVWRSEVWSSATGTQTHLTPVFGQVECTLISSNQPLSILNGSGQVYSSASDDEMPDRAKPEKNNKLLKKEEKKRKKE